MAAAVVLVLAGAYVAGGRAARRSAELDTARKNLHVKRRADRVAQEIDALGDDSVHRRARRWMRGEEL